MSITPKQWSDKDEAGTVPDATLRYETYFNTADGYLYRVVDFILVQEPGKEHMVYPEARKGEVAPPGYAAVNPGDERWYIVLEKNDALGDRRAFRYDDFREDRDHYFHRVKNDKPKVQTRALPEDVVRGGPHHHEIDGRRRISAEPRMVTVESVGSDAVVGRTVALDDGRDS